MKTATLILRPEHEAKVLAALLAQHGVVSRIFSTVMIVPLMDAKQCSEALQTIPHHSHLIFTSVNAVRTMASVLPLYRAQPLYLYAVGATTAHELNKLGFEKVIHPQIDFCSESLLPLLQPQLQPHAQVYIITGVDGRQWLGQQLQLLGASVHYIDCYQRQCQAYYDDAVLEQWQRENIKNIVATSQSALENLWQIVDGKGRKFLSECRIITFSERIAQYALHLAFTAEIAICKEASNEGILEALLKRREDE